MATILLVDDDVTLLTMLGEQLETAGHTVNKMSEVNHARQAFIEQQPDMVLIEVRTGRDQGWGLLQEFAPAAPVIVVSGAAREEDVVRGLELGAADYVAKPYRSDELLARIRVRLATARVAPPSSVPEVLYATPPTPLKRRDQDRRGQDADESVFMTEAEEIALLRMTDKPPQPSQVVLHQNGAGEGDQSIGQQFRAERLRRHLSLVQIENETRIRMAYLQAMEDNKFTLLPRGPAALQMVQTYSEYLGLEAEPLLSQYRELHYVEPAEPLPSLGGPRHERPLPRLPIAFLAVALALALAIGVLAVFDPGLFSLIGDLWFQALRWFDTLF